MTPIYISVQPKDLDDFRFAHFEDRGMGTQAASRWCLELNKKYPTAPLVLFMKHCGRYVGAHVQNLRAVLHKWVGRKSLPQDLVIPLVTETGHELNVLVPTQTTPEGWMLTNKDRTAYRNPADLPPDFLLECLNCNDIPDGCPIKDLEDAVAALPPIL